MARSGLRKNSRRSNSPGNRESGNGEEHRRTTTVRKQNVGRAKNERFGVENNLNSGQRQDGWCSDDGGFNFAVRNRHNGAIVIVGDGPAVKPGMERGILLGHRHEQPEGEGQQGRAGVQSQSPATVYKLTNRLHPKPKIKQQLRQNYAQVKQMSVFIHPAASLQRKPPPKPPSTSRPDRMKSNAALAGMSGKLASLRKEF